MKTNTLVRVYTKIEANYGGGDAGILFAKAFPAAVAGFLAMNHFAGNIKVKSKSFTRKRIKGPGTGLGTGKVITNGVDFPEIELSYYLQTAVDPFKADAVGGTEGSEGTSRVLNIVIPDETEAATTKTYCCFGAQLTSYAINNTVPEEPVVTVKFTCYDISVDPTPIDMSAVAIPTGVINEWDDVVVTVDGDVITELSDYTLEIKNIFGTAKPGKNSTFDRFIPLLKDKEFDFKIKMSKDSAAILQDTITQAVNSFTAIWTEGTNTITVTNCFNDSDDFLEYAGDAIVDQFYTVNLKNGESVFT